MTTARQLNIKTAAAQVSEAMRDIELLAERLKQPSRGDWAAQAALELDLAADLLCGALERLRDAADAGA